VLHPVIEDFFLALEAVAISAASFGHEGVAKLMVRILFVSILQFITTIYYNYCTRYLTRTPMEQAASTRATHTFSSHARTQATLRLT